VVADYHEFLHSSMKAVGIERPYNKLFYKIQKLGYACTVTPTGPKSIEVNATITHGRKSERLNMSFTWTESTDEALDDIVDKASEAFEKKKEYLKNGMIMDEALE